jgi:hypothetical protein
MVFFYSHDNIRGGKNNGCLPVAQQIKHIIKTRAVSFGPSAAMTDTYAAIEAAFLDNFRLSIGDPDGLCLAYP